MSTLSRIQKAIRLHTLEAAEVSLVPQGANRRRFLIFKRGGKDMEADPVEKGGPGSGRKPGGGSGDKKEPEKKDEGKKGEGKTIGKTTSGKDIHETGEKSTKGWSSQDHMDAFHAHTEKGMDAHAAMMAHPSFQAARTAGDHYRTPEQAAAISSDPKVREHQATSDKHHAIAEQHYQASKKVKKSRFGELMAKIRKADPKMMERVQQCMTSYGTSKVAKAPDGGGDGKVRAGGTVGDSNPAPASLSDEAQAALKAAARILGPHVDEIPADLVHKVIEASGYEVKENPEGPETGAGDGQTELPDSVNKKKDGSAVDNNGEEHVSKSASDTPSLEGLDPKTRETLEGVFKSNAELVQKNADLEKRVKDAEVKDRQREIVAKASAFTALALPQDQIVAMLTGADAQGKEALELVEKNLSVLNEQAAKSNLFKELGSNLPKGGNSEADLDRKIAALGDSIVAKSGEKMTDAQKYERALFSPEGQALYKQHQAARGGI